jgi:hypothetical protein
VLWRVIANEPVEDCSLWNRFRLYIGLFTFEQISTLAAVYRVLSNQASKQGEEW